MELGFTKCYRDSARALVEGTENYKREYSGLDCDGAPLGTTNL